MSESFKIAGAYYRPPAMAILKVLPLGTKLILRPEPDNPVDPYAVKICVPTSELSDEMKAKLESEVINYGFTMSDIEAQDDWHLGYVPRQEAVVLSAKLDHSDACAELAFAPDGKPMALWSGNSK